MSRDRKMKIWMKLSMCVAGLLVAAGCATPIPIPATYYQVDEPVVQVVITRVPNSPTMLDSGQGGIPLVGEIVNATRAATMKKVMGDIKGNTLKSLMKQKIESRLEEQFFIEDKSDYLLLSVVIQRWGWFCPSAMLGIRTGNYQLQIQGDVIVYDVKTKKKKKVGFMRAVGQESLGTDPESVNIQEVLLKAVDAYCDKTIPFLLSNAPKQ